MPGNGVITEIHAGAPVTVHEQPAGIVTPSAAIPPATANVGPLPEESVAVQTPPADCDTDWVAPAITSVALRARRC
jgi:hypothetical protein